MYEILKTVCAAQTPTAYGFTYARRDYANLYDEVPTGQIQVFLDPVQITEAYSDYNVVESREHQGTFMVLISSDLEKGDYEQRYIDQIKPLLNTALGNIKDSIKCDGTLQIVSWRTVEAINVFDYNMDGIVVTYTVREDV